MVMTVKLKAILGRLEDGKGKGVALTAAEWEEVKMWYSHCGTSSYYFSAVSPNNLYPISSQDRHDVFKTRRLLHLSPKVPCDKLNKRHKVYCFTPTHGSYHNYGKCPELPRLINELRLKEEENG